MCTFNNKYLNDINIKFSFFLDLKRHNFDDII